MPSTSTTTAAAKPAAPPPTAEETFAAMLAAGDPVARYAEAHGRWQEEVHRGNGQTTIVRTLVWCACPICTDVRASLDAAGA